MRDEPYWWDDAPLTTEPPAALPQRTDVAVIGAGYTGLSAALTLARAGRSVVVLEAGVPGVAKLAGLVGAAVGFFVIPYVGLFVGFPVGVFAAEQVRLRDSGRAWAATKAAVKAVLTSIGIELAAAVLVSWIWVVGVVLT